MHDKILSKMHRVDYVDLPLVYSCSGCSNAAQLANTLAVRMDRERLAEMSCIAGIGGDVKPVVNKAHSGRPIIVLDGCALHCAKNCLHRHGMEPDLHIDLSKSGIRKRYHEDVSLAETHRVWKELVPVVIREFHVAAASPTAGKTQSGITASAGSGGPAASNHAAVACSLNDLL